MGYEEFLGVHRRIVVIGCYGPKGALTCEIVALVVTGVALEHFLGLVGFIAPGMNVGEIGRDIIDETGRGMAAAAVRRGTGSRNGPPGAAGLEVVVPPRLSFDVAMAALGPLDISLHMPCGVMGIVAVPAFPDSPRRDEGRRIAVPFQAGVFNVGRACNVIEVRGDERSDGRCGGMAPVALQGSVRVQKPRLDCIGAAMACAA